MVDYLLCSTLMLKGPQLRDPRNRQAGYGAYELEEASLLRVPGPKRATGERGDNQDVRTNKAEGTGPIEQAARSIDRGERLYVGTGPETLRDATRRARISALGAGGTAGRGDPGLRRAGDALGVGGLFPGFTQENLERARGG